MDNVVNIEKVFNRVDNGLKKTFFSYKRYVYQLKEAYKGSYVVNADELDTKELANAELFYYNYLMGVFHGLHIANVISSREYSLCMDELYNLHYE